LFNYPTALEKIEIGRKTEDSSILLNSVGYKKPIWKLLMLMQFVAGGNTNRCTKSSIHSRIWDE
jgi:hypothetical protein